MIVMKNKFPFLSSELLTARAKAEWNKKLASMNKSFRKKMPLTFEAKRSQIIRSKTKKNESFSNKDFETTKQSMIEKESPQKSLLVPESNGIIDESSTLMEDIFNHEPLEIVSEKSNPKCSISDAYLPINFDGNDDNRLTTTIEVVPQKMSISKTSTPLYLNDDE